MKDHKMFLTLLGLLGVLASGVQTVLSQEKASPGLAPIHGLAQTTAQQPPDKAAASPAANAQEKNLNVYIDLMRADVRQQKAEMMGSVMLLSAADAAKFWPIYNEYDVALAKLNDMRVENIKEYARSYTQLTNEEADHLIRQALAYQKNRAELFAKTYDRVNQALGGVTAARFFQVENQLLLLIDLQISSSLPVAGEGS